MDRQVRRQREAVRCIAGASMVAVLVVYLAIAAERVG